MTNLFYIIFLFLCLYSCDEIILEGYEKLSSKEQRFLNYTPNRYGGDWVRSVTAHPSLDLLYVIDHTYGLKVLDTKDKSNPKLISSFKVASTQEVGLRPYRMSIDDNIGVLSNSSGQLYILDLTNPRYPNVVYENANITVRAVKLYGNLMFLSQKELGVGVYDISNPKSPVLLTMISTSANAETMLYDNGYLYVAIGTQGIEIFNLLDLQNPQLVSTIDSTRHSFDIVKNGNFLYVADWVNGLWVIDVADPMTPSSVGYYQTNGQRTFEIDIDPIRNIIFLADMHSGLHLIDISDHANLTEISRPGRQDYWSTHNQIDVHYKDNYIYMADDSAGAAIYNVSDPLNPVRESLYNTTMYIHRHLTRGNYAYLIDAQLSAFIIVDISNPKKMVFMDQVKFPGTGDANPNIFREVFVDDTRAFVTSDTGVHFYDISNKRNIVDIGFYPVVDGAFRITKKDDVLYFTSNAGGINALDISDLSSPTLLGNYVTANKDWAEVIVQDNLIFYNGGLNDIEIVDISDPTNMTMIGSINADGDAGFFEVKGSALYVPYSNNVIRLYDINDPTSPAELSSISTPATIRNVKVVGNNLYYSRFKGWHVQRVDYTDPLNPTLSDIYKTSDWSCYVTIKDNYLFVSSYDAGFESLKL